MSIKTMGWQNPSPLYFNNSSELAQNRQFWSPNINSSSAALCMRTPPPCLSQSRAKGHRGAHPDSHHRVRTKPELVLRVRLPLIHLFAFLSCFGESFSVVLPSRGSTLTALSHLLIQNNFQH